MQVQNKNNKFVSYLIILVTLFILVLVTKDQVVNLQENLDLKETYANELSSKKVKLGELNTLKSEIINSQDNM
ncbi:hypothetical protein HOF65_04360 [bacterium]|jgi:hypothetical protein|nr:hypothetical protein [bacterium]MBT3853197.1 hypothetical protein [bacterium]MBT4633701.1 hypothetical protein [bacterium]MBT5492462.1 hypothetical protein [bacterium]MBT6779397.1 hypothetical protein [bacterium]